MPLSQKNLVDIYKGSVILGELNRVPLSSRSESMNAAYTKIEGKDKDAGSWVYTSQGVASDKGFGHVSKHWYKQTKSYDDGLAELDAGKAETEDVRCSLAEFTPSVTADGQFCMEYNGRQFIPTEHALNQLGTLYGLGQWYVRQLRESKIAGAGAQLASDLLFWRKGLDPAKPQLFRTRKDGSLRAVLGGGNRGYAIVDNRWYLELIRRIIPGGRLSHWRGDADSIYGNILIPDTIREDSDSDYGGMVSIGNSEIGLRSIDNRPSVFRAICMNGCIWGQEFGKMFRQVHKGKLDLVKLEAAIRTCIEAQIPLLPAGISRLLATRQFTTNVSMKPIIAELAIGHKLSPSQASRVLTAYLDEIKAVPEFEKSLFSVVNAFTRAGQGLENTLWLNFDKIGGELANWGQDDWNSLVKRASTLKAEVVEEAFATAV